MNNVTKMYMLVGIPGSGKSTYAIKLKEKYRKDNKNINIFSSDDMRDEGIEENVLFDTLHNSVFKSLEEGVDCVYDATNLNRKRRMNFLRLLKNYKCKKICVCKLTPFETCMERNEKRRAERIVPEYAMHRMLKNFEIPMMEEGFNEVLYVREKSDGRFFHSIDKMNDISHDNPHHSNTIGHHMLEASKYIDENYAEDRDYINIKIAARYHDIGKPFTKGFINTKGEKTETAHYYGHDNVSAYFFITEIADYINEKHFDEIMVTELINWHMRPFLAWKRSEKSYWKDKKFLGERKMNALLKVHEADLHAH